MKKLNAVFLIISLIFAMTGCRENEATVISKRAEDAVVSSDPIPSEKENISLTIGRKEVEDYEVTLSVIWDGEEGEISGKYTGTFVDGKPEGEGHWRTESDEMTYDYWGSFTNGRFNGNGRAVITADGESMTMEGTYTNGEYTPTVGETFNYIGQLDYFGKFTVPSDVVQYVDSHLELFPTAIKDNVQSIETKNFLYKKFVKTRMQEDLGLVKLSLYAVQVFEDDCLNGKLTSVLAVDTDGNYYVLYYLDTVEVYEGDEFTAYALPCSTSGFDNVGGGTTNVVVMLASYMG